MFSESPFEGSLFECYWCVVLFSEISSFRDGQGTNERKENKRIKDIVWPTLSLLGKISIQTDCTWIPESLCCFCVFMCIAQFGQGWFSK